MSTDSTTQSVLFPQLFSRETVVAKFDQEHSSSDGGALLFKAVDEQLGLSQRLAACLGDRRQPGNKVALGFVEGLNIKIRVIQRHAYGLRDEEYLRLKILTATLPPLKLDRA